MPPGSGDVAPDFTLPGIDGTPAGRRLYSLSELRGQPVVLVFYPADRSPVCTVQLTTYSADIGRFATLGAAVLAISPQTLDEHEAFAAAEGGFAFPLLSDANKAVGRSYGILGPLGFYRRSVFVIDRDGVIRWAHRSPSGLTFRSVDELVDVLAELAA